MSNAEDLNPRAIAGGNNPPVAAIISEAENFAQTVTDFLNERFRESEATVAALLEEAHALPNPIVDDADKSKYTSLIKRIRDEAKRLDAFHEKEGTNYLRGKQAVDQFFFGKIDRLLRRSKTNKPGGGDVLLSRLTVYDMEVLRQQQAERKRIADEAARVAREAQEKAAREAQEAEEKRLAAERARKPEIVETKQQAAAVAETQASVSAAKAEIAADQAKAAHVDTLAKPADLMRMRSAEGTLSTMVTEPFAEIEDEALLDKDKLWPFIPIAAKEQALRAFARNNGHKPDSMPGALIGRRPKSAVR